MNKKKSSLVGVSLLILILFVQFWVSEPSDTLTLSDYTEAYVIAHLQEGGSLPDYYITKNQAYDLGWEPEEGNLWQVAYGRVIGGDVFYNREGLLPDAPSRTWYEADINYQGGFRGGDRLVFSSDGLIYTTYDHYKTFKEVD